MDSKTIIEEWYKNIYISPEYTQNKKHRAIIRCWNAGVPPQYLAKKIKMKPQGIHYVLNKYKK